MKANSPHIPSVDITRFANRTNASMYSCVGEVPTTLPRRTTKKESEPPSNYDLSNHGKILMDNTMLRTMPFQRSVVDKRKLNLKIEKAVKDMKQPRSKPRKGEGL